MNSFSLSSSLGSNTLGGNSLGGISLGNNNLGSNNEGQQSPLSLGNANTQPSITAKNKDCYRHNRTRKIPSMAQNFWGTNADRLFNRNIGSTNNTAPSTTPSGYVPTKYNAIDQSINGNYGDSTVY